MIQTFLRLREWETACMILLSKKENLVDSRMCKEAKRFSDIFKPVYNEAR